MLCDFCGVVANYLLKIECIICRQNIGVSKKGLLWKRNIRFL